MSIAILAQVYDEARRLAVAGSVVARGDFRLKKLLPPLDQAGAKAPVFAKVAEAARAVIDGPEAQSAENLLELTSLVTAVLYTQGETGLAGDLEPIETTDLGGTTTAISAQMLKPLLEAFQRTGSGRLELVKDAHQRSAFRDLRLVKPALDALDDPYAELADFVMEQVLPLYGKAILPELHAKFDMKGGKGNPRRLKLMHALDPAGTREWVKQALDGGSKDVKVAAIECLGSVKEDLAYLIEMASAKAEPVRGAAYSALAKSEDPAALAVLEKAIGGKDLELATAAIKQGKGDKSTMLLVTEIEKRRDELLKHKDKKQVSETVRQLVELIQSLPEDEHPAADALTLDLFSRRDVLTKIKGESQSGSDVVESVIWRMCDGSKLLQSTLARSHSELETEQLNRAVLAAHQSLTAAEVYDLFSPYLAIKADVKKRPGEAASRQELVLVALGANHIHPLKWYRDHQPISILDPRWLDLALRLNHLGLVCATGRPGNPAVESFLQTTFDAVSKKAKSQDELQDVLAVMIRLEHPRAAESLIASYQKTVGKANVNTYWYYQLIPELPKSAFPLLEAVVPKLKDPEVDHWLRAVQKLRDRE